MMTRRSNKSKAILKIPSSDHLSSLKHRISSQSTGPKTMLIKVAIRVSPNELPLSLFVQISQILQILNSMNITNKPISDLIKIGKDSNITKHSLSLQILIRVKNSILILTMILPSFSDLTRMQQTVRMVEESSLTRLLINREIS